MFNMIHIWGQKCWFSLFSRIASLNIKAEKETAKHYSLCLQRIWTFSLTRILILSLSPKSWGVFLLCPSQQSEIEKKCKMKNESHLIRKKEVSKIRKFIFFKNELKINISYFSGTEGIYLISLEIRCKFVQQYFKICFLLLPFYLYTNTHKHYSQINETINKYKTIIFYE